MRFIGAFCVRLLKRPILGTLWGEIVLFEAPYLSEKALGVLPTVRYGYCDAENLVRRKMERKFKKENCAKAGRKQFDKSLVEGPPYRGIQKILIYLQSYRLGCLD